MALPFGQFVQHDNASSEAARVPIRIEAVRFHVELHGLSVSSP